VGLADLAVQVGAARAGRLLDDPARLDPGPGVLLDGIARLHPDLEYELHRCCPRDVAGAGRALGASVGASGVPEPWTTMPRLRRAAFADSLLGPTILGACGHGHEANRAGDHEDHRRGARRH